MKFIIVILFSLITSLSYAQPLRIVTEKLPPLQFSEKDGVSTGAMTDIVKLLLQKSNLKSEIEILPWARSYQLATSRKNTLIFSMLRSESRENDFIWVGKLFALESYLMALKNHKIFNINSIEDAKQYSVGSIRQDLAASYLREHGFIKNENLYLSSDYTTLWQLVFKKRTDLAFTNSILWKYEIEELGLDPTQVEIVYKAPAIASNLYLAASIGTDEKVINQLRKALKEIKANGQYQQILQKWHLTTPIK